MDTLPSSLSDFVDEVPASETTLLIVNRTGPDPFRDLLDKAFANQSVTIAERQISDGTDALVCLIKDGEVVATSPFKRLQNAFLLVNSDRFRTGTRPVDPDQFPDVLTGLTDIEFTVAGYPVSNKEKLLLIVMSGFVEHLALATGHGRLDSTFQRLSRLDDEYGTKTMYKRLGDGGVETHVYGLRDDPEAVRELNVSTHSDTTEQYRRSWVVAFTPGDQRSAVETDPTHAALVAIEIGPNVWRGFWTFDSTRVERIQSYIQQNF